MSSMSWARARLPFISVMTDPTTGGVSASLALLQRVPPLQAA
jgi:acetyl-CoA carboxylase beta subunit